MSFPYDPTDPPCRALVSLLATSIHTITPRTIWRLVLLLALVILVAATACTSTPSSRGSGTAGTGAGGGGGAQAGQAGQGNGFRGGGGRNGASAEASPQPLPSPSPSGSLASRPVDGGLSMPFRSGEYALTANRDDRSLSIVPVGVATVTASVPVDGTPLSVWTASAPDRAFVLSAGVNGRTLTVTNIDAMTPAQAVEVGTPPDRIGGAPGGAGGPLLLISDSENSIRSLDPNTLAVGPTVPLGAGPHSVSVDVSRSRRVQRILVANGGDGTVTTIDPDVTRAIMTTRVGGRPVGVAPSAVAGSDAATASPIWVADGDASSLSLVDPSSGTVKQTVPVGPGLTGLVATADARYLVLASSDPVRALYAIDGTVAASDPSNVAVKDLRVDAGVVQLAAGEEPTVAYVITADDKLLYWELTSDTITRTVAVGHGPVSLALGLVKLAGSQPLVSDSQGGGSAASSGGGGSGAGGGTGGGGGGSSSAEVSNNAGGGSGAAGRAGSGAAGGGGAGSNTGGGGGGGGGGAVAASASSGGTTGAGGGGGGGTTPRAGGAGGTGGGGAGGGATGSGGAAGGSGGAGGNGGSGGGGASTVNGAGGAGAGGRTIAARGAAGAGSAGNGGGSGGGTGGAAGGAGRASSGGGSGGGRSAGGGGSGSGTSTASATGGGAGTVARSGGSGGGGGGSASSGGSSATGSSVSSGTGSGGSGEQQSELCIVLVIVGPSPAEGSDCIPLPIGGDRTIVVTEGGTSAVQRERSALLSGR